MNSLTVLKIGRYEVLSYGNGWAYRINRNDGYSLWLQDDDATQFSKIWEVDDYSAFISEYDDVFSPDAVTE